MKKTYLLIFAIIAGLISFGQSALNNLDIGLSANGTNGSGSGTGGYVAVSLRIKTGGVAYGAPPTNPVAEDLVIYLVAPKTDFSTSDLVIFTEVNSAMYGSSSVALMLEQGVFDADPLNSNANLYFPVVLNSGSGLNLSSLSAVTHAWSFAFTFKFNNTKTAAAFNKLKIVDQVNNTELNAATSSTLFSNLQMASSNQLTNTAFSTLPVSLINFSGYKNGTKNTLRWTTANEESNRGFAVQRSLDGSNYEDIGFVNSLAPGGFSSSSVSYTYDDMNPAGRKQYYRLRQVDIDGKSKLSNIILITGDKPAILGIGGLFPNPASSLVNVIINAPGRDRVTLVVTDLSGKKVKQQLVSVETGSNTIPVEVSNLASGSYLVKLICQSSDCEAAAGKFNKL